MDLTAVPAPAPGEPLLVAGTAGLAHLLGLPGPRTTGCDGSNCCAEFGSAEEREAAAWGHLRPVLGEGLPEEAQEWGSWQQPRKEVPLPSLDVGGAHEEGMLSKAEGWGALTEAPPGS